VTNSAFFSFENPDVIDNLDGVLRVIRDRFATRL
jgi:hypothetical protein